MTAHGSTKSPNRPVRFAALIATALGFCVAAPVIQAADTASADILAVMKSQQDYWNAAKIPEFVQYYADDCVFFGKSKTVGREAVRKRYEKTYPTPDAMGQLTFSQLEVTMLDPNVAIVLGHFHLERTAAGGGNADGVFSLVFQRKSNRWQIVLDHTS